ncbi:hypothetical protein DERF_008966, partial [Dermatophagoides farinae]
MNLWSTKLGHKNDDEVQQTNHHHTRRSFVEFFHHHSSFSSIYVSYSFPKKKQQQQQQQQGKLFNHQFFPFLMINRESKKKFNLDAIDLHIHHCSAADF